MWRKRIAFAFLFVIWASYALGDQTLSSWNAGPARQKITDFVARVTNPSDPDFVKPGDRVAVFDNDGTLWPEWPLYTPILFALERLEKLAPKHPEWRRNPLFRAALAHDLDRVRASGESGQLKIVAATYSGDTPEKFREEAANWTAHTRHPLFGRPFEDLAYQPMLELLSYLRANGFKVYIVSGGETEFLRAFAERLYGAAPEQVLGSQIATHFMFADGDPILLRDPRMINHDVKAQKPVTISQAIGRRPIIAFGNSDGDIEMLQWTMAGQGARLALLLRHDDAAREAAYDRGAPVGRLDRGLDEAHKRGWTVVSMKNDWRQVFVGEKTKPAPATQDDARDR